MIQISDSAAQQVRVLKKRDQLKEEDFLRVSVKEGGCSGFSYKLDFDKKKQGKRQSIYLQRGGFGCGLQKPALFNGYDLKL